MILACVPASTQWSLLSKEEILAEKGATAYTLPMSTKVRLANLRFDGYHGATAEERSLPRRFEVDLELEADFGVPERSDRLTDAVDYAEVAGIVMAIGTGPAFHLVEALARRMVDALQERWPQVMVSLFLASTCSHSSVAREPIGVIFGPRSLPITLA